MFHSLAGGLFARSKSKKGIQQASDPSLTDVDSSGASSAPSVPDTPATPAAPPLEATLRAKKSDSEVLVTAQEATMCARRVKREYQELREEILRAHNAGAAGELPHLLVAMDPEDHLQWYVLIHSLADPCFVGGEYLFLVSLSPRYPLAPPDFFFLTPNGRFQTNRKLCFSNSSYHAEKWSPVWKIKTLVLGFLSFFLESSSKGVGHLRDVTDEAKREFALQSKEYNAAHHQRILDMIYSQNPQITRS